LSAGHPVFTRWLRTRTVFPPGLGDHASNSFPSIIADYGPAEQGLPTNSLRTQSNRSRFPSAAG
jgi:hypothetical protein